MGQREEGNKNSQERSAPVSTWSLPYLRLHRSDRKILFAEEQPCVFPASLCISFICPEEGRLSHERGRIWIPLKMLHTSSLRGSALIRSLTSPSPLLCVFLPLTCLVWVLPSNQPPLHRLGPSTSSWHHPYLPAGLSWSCVTSWAGVTQGWLGSHSDAHSSSALCMRWQDSQAQAVSPIKCLSRSSTFKCHSCHMNERKGSKMKLGKKKKNRRNQRVAAETESEKSSLD